MSEERENVYQILELGKHIKNLHHKKGFGGLLFIDLSMIKFSILSSYIRQLDKENQELKKQLENKYSKIVTLTNEVLYEENTKLINQQKEFIEYLENMLDDENDIFSVARVKDVLQKYKEINRKVIRRR